MGRRCGSNRWQIFQEEEASDTASRGILKKEGMEVEKAFHRGEGNWGLGDCPERV